METPEWMALVSGGFPDTERNGEFPAKIRAKDRYFALKNGANRKICVTIRALS